VRARTALLTGPFGVCWRAAALLLLAAFSVLQASAQVTTAYVVELQLASSMRVTRDLSDFTYRIRVVNQGGALVGARATVRSLSANTVIRDNEVLLGSVPAGTTITSIDTFTLRQNRLVAFRPSDLVWTIEGQPANTRPIANAGSDQTVRTGTVVALDGTGSTDADGQALSYRWSLLARPAGSAAVLSSTTAPRPTFTVDRGGDYIFRLVVNDGQVDSVFDEVQVSTLNSAPVANAGVDRTVARGSLVTLDGSASSDPDFDALAFRWSVTARPNGSTATLSDATAMQPQIRLDLPGEYRFTLVVNDGEFDSSADAVAISTENSAPVARPVGPATATRGAVVALDGSASGDADGDPLEFLWSWTSRPIGSAAVLDVTDNLRPVFTPDVFGDYVVQLIVNDGWANSAPATVTVAVPQPPNRAPNAVADSASTPAGAAVDIAVLANDSDPDGDALTLLSFTQPANGAVVQAGSALRFTPAGGFGGSTSFSYTISDGRETATALVTVTVIGAVNTAPTVFAGPDQDVTAPYANATLNVSLAGSVSDDGRPTPAQLTTIWTVVAGPGPVLFEVADRASTRVTLAAPGTYTLRLTASDGALTGSDELELRVGTAGNRPPVLAPLPDRVLAVGESLAIQLAANDPDPEDQLTFSLTSGPAGAAVDATGRLRWTATTPGSFGFTIAVRDTGGLGGSRSFTATVTSGNRAPVFVALTDDRTAPGASYRKTLAATDPDGDAPLSFELLGGPHGLTLSGAQISWQPGVAQIGSTVVQLAVRDPSGAQGVGVYSIDVESNTAPGARDDEYTVRVGETLTVAGPGVLANDADAEGSALSARSVSSPGLGSLTALNPDGGFSYVAPPAFTRHPIELVGRPLTTSIFINDFAARQVPTIGDADGDGRPEFTYVGQGGPVVSLRGGSGAIAWTSSLGACGGAGLIGAGSGSPQVLADVDDDGALEYVIHGACIGVGFFNQLVALDARTGAVDWTSPEVTAPIFTPPCDLAGNCGAPIRMRASTLAFATLSVARLGATEGPVLLARDHISEFAAPIYTIIGTNPATGANVLGTRYYGCEIATGNPADRGLPCNVTYLISGTDGSVIDVLRAPPTPRDMANTAPLERLPPVTVDLDGDGDVEIVSGSEVWTRQGGEWVLAWQLPAEPNQTVVVDLDLDGRVEIVHLIERRGFFPPAPFAGFTGLIVYSADGTEQRRIPMPLGNQATISAADVDGDGTPELMWQDTGTVRVLGGDGAVRWTFVIPDHPTRLRPQGTRATLATNLVVYDLDGDGARELAFNGSSYVFVLDAATGVERARFDVGFRSIGGASTLMLHVTDWDADGHADLIATGQGNNTPGNPGSWVITSARNDWLPAPTYYGSNTFRSSSFGANGRVLFDTSVPRDFRNPRQLGTVADLRVTQGTSFQYVANDGSVDSAPATVFVRIAPPNSPPVITSTPPSAVQGQDGGAFTYAATATDPDAGDTITWSARLVQASNGISESLALSVNPATGVLSINRNVAFGTYDMLVQVTATDSQGASTSQSFVVRHEIGARSPLPSVVGSTYATATTTLSSAGFIAALLEERPDSAPAGQVIAQNPSAGSAQTRGTVVRLTVSTGPAPALVPTVVGLTQGQATTRLTATGFSVGAITREFSETAPRGTVIGQSPGAGALQAPGPVALAISAGNGFSMRLSSAVTPAAQALPFQALAVDLSGVETPATGFTATLTRIGVGAGPMPTVIGTTVQTDATTRGRYRLQLVDGNGRRAAAEFVVTQPAVAGAPAPMAASFRALSQAMTDIDTLLAEARVALATGDVARQEALLRQMVRRWRQVDIEDLRLSIPLAPETGFAPLVEQMAGFGVSGTAEDLLVERLLQDAAADLAAWTAGLRAPGTTLTQLNQLADAFGTRAARLDGLDVTEWGAVNASNEYTLLLARRIPALYEAIMDELAVVVGEPPTRVATAADPQRSSVFERAYVAESGSDGEARAGGVEISSTLSELLVTQATQWVVDKIIDDFNERYKNAKQYGEDVMKQAFYGAFTVAAVSHVRQFIQSQDTGTFVAGASLSLHVFDAPYSMIEGPWDIQNPEMNEVYVIGPRLFEQVREFIEAIQEASDYRDVVDPTTEDGRYKSVEEIKEDLKEFRDYLQDVADEFGDIAQRVYQPPDAVDAPCLFEAGPRCSQLIWENGFESVYEYEPPPGFESFTGLPLPIVFMIYNYRDNQFYFATPAFFPTLPEDEGQQ
jgi:hypothetical protein